MLFMSLLSPFARAQTTYTATGYVNDYAQVLTSDQKAQLDTDLQQFYESTSNQVVVAIIPNLGGQDIESYANDLFRLWGVGEKTKNNGVLLLIAMSEHRLRIEVGYGLEGAIPDALAGRIINNTIAPHFKTSDYYGGISAGVQAIEQAARGEYHDSPVQMTTLSEGAFQLFVWAIIILSWIASFLSRSKSIWGGGVVGAFFGVIGFFVIHSFVLKGIAFIGAVLIGIALDAIVSRSYQQNISRGGRGTFWATRGGFWGGGGSGWLGGGGFGGFGGGSSGGGGASGGW